MLEACRVLKKFLLED